MLRVSIHQLPDLLDPFQSSPTPKGGRYADALSRLSRGVCFNPRPLRKVGATLTLYPLPSHNNPFQSSPTPKGGRYFSVCQSLPNSFLFQSSPTPKGGRYVPARLVKGSSVARSFNPRPPRKVGATPPSRGLLDHQPVSILAHPERWALRSFPRLKGIGVCRFNPRPPRKVGATPD